jgi:putative spermidine/putrescine transport system substrate-binding protein
MQRRGKGCFTPSLRHVIIAFTPGNTVCTVLARRVSDSHNSHFIDGDENMLRKIRALTLLTTCVLSAGHAMAADKLIVSTWGGGFKDLIDETIAKAFTKETGVEVQFVTGGTIDRLNKAKLAGGSPETDVTFTTAHVGYLYANSGLFEKLDMSKIPNAANLVQQAKVSPYHLGVWGYVYTIGYRPDLVPKGETFASWNDLWKPELKGTLALPDWDPSHIIAVAAKLSGTDAALAARPGEAQGADPEHQILLYR